MVFDKNPLSFIIYNILKKEDCTLKKIIVLFLLVKIVWGQTSFDKFIGEKISAEVRWLTLKVAVIDIEIGLSLENDSLMTVYLTSQTIGLARGLVATVDTIYTEFNRYTGQFKKTYRFAASDDLLTSPDTSWTYLTKNGREMTYKYLQTGQSPFFEKVVVDSSFSPTDLQEVITLGMQLRTREGLVNDVHYLSILGKNNNQVIPKIMPLIIKQKEIVNIENEAYQALKCDISLMEKIHYFREENHIKVWISDDQYHFPLMAQVDAIVPLPIPFIGIKEVKTTVYAYVLISQSVLPYTLTSKISNQ